MQIRKIQNEAMQISPTIATNSETDVVPVCTQHRTQSRAAEKNKLAEERVCCQNLPLGANQNTSFPSDIPAPANCYFGAMQDVPFQNMKNRSTDIGKLSELTPTNPHEYTSLGLYDRPISDRGYSSDQDVGNVPVNIEPVRYVDEIRSQKYSENVMRNSMQPHDYPEIGGFQSHVYSDQETPEDFKSQMEQAGPVFHGHNQDYQNIGTQSMGYQSTLHEYESNSPPLSVSWHNITQ